MKRCLFLSLFLPAALLFGQAAEKLRSPPTKLLAR